jgi:hypothetical protein
MKHLDLKQRFTTKIHTTLYYEYLGSETMIHNKTQ